MTDTTTPPVADPCPPPTRPAAVAIDNRFFAWVRGLGIVRTQGWLGGVSTGLAVRMGIDPVIVRGLFVVAALIGFPALLAYAVAWALLPDVDGRIPAQQLGRGRFEPTMIAIGIMALLGLVPTIPWLWSAVFWPISGGAWGVFAGFGGFINGLLTVLLIGGIIALVIWLIVRASHNSRGGMAPGPRTASVDPTAPGFPSEHTTADAFPAAVDAALVPPPAEPIEPSAPATPPAPESPAPLDADATADEVAAWRARQAEWRVQRDAWRRQQAETEAAAREQSRREREAVGRAFAVEAEARRRARQAANPRASAVLVLAVLGAGLVAGAITALATAGLGVGLAAAAGILVAALVCAIGMIVAGAVRRRSGFLAFSTITLLVVGLVTAGLASAGQLVLGSAAIGNSGYQEDRFVQPAGDVTLYVMPNSAADWRSEPLVLRKGTGYTHIQVESGVTLQLDAQLGDGTVTFVRIDKTGDITETGDIPSASLVDGRRTFHWSVSNEDPEIRSVIVPVRIEQNAGDIQVTVHDR